MPGRRSSAGGRTRRSPRGRRQRPSTSAAKAAFIEAGNFNPATQNLEMVLVYSGGLQEHNFTLTWDNCQETDQGMKEIAARLIDTGWEDTGTEELSQVVSFNLSDLGTRFLRFVYGPLPGLIRLIEKSTRQPCIQGIGF